MVATRQAGPATLTVANSWGSEDVEDAGTDVFAQFGPPFDLTADLLFTLALCPTPPLRRAFPGVPFLSVLGRTPLVIWFSQITRGCYVDAAGQRRCDGAPGRPLYFELNALALLGRPALFVPSIYATSRRSIRIGRRYGRPKDATAMSFQASGRWVRSLAQAGARRSWVEAHVLGSGRGLPKLLAPFWPRPVWPVCFPSGRTLRGAILATPRVHLSRILAGQLAVEADWLPEAMPLLPIGLYTPGLRMELPPERTIALSQMIN